MKKLKVATITVVDDDGKEYTTNITSEYIACTTGNVETAAYLIACIYAAGGDSAVMNYLKEKS